MYNTSSKTLIYYQLVAAGFLQTQMFALLFYPRSASLLAETKLWGKQKITANPQKHLIFCVASSFGVKKIENNTSKWISKFSWIWCVLFAPFWGWCKTIYPTQQWLAVNLSLNNLDLRNCGSRCSCQMLIGCGSEEICHSLQEGPNVLAECT